MKLDNLKHVQFSLEQMKIMIDMLEEFRETISTAKNPGVTAAMMSGPLDQIESMRLDMLQCVKRLNDQAAAKSSGLPASSLDNMSNPSAAQSFSGDTH